MVEVTNGFPTPSNQNFPMSESSSLIVGSHSIARAPSGANLEHGNLESDDQIESIGEDEDNNIDVQGGFEWCQTVWSVLLNRPKVAVNILRRRRQSSGSKTSSDLLLDLSFIKSSNLGLTLLKDRSLLDDHREAFEAPPPIFPARFLMLEQQRLPQDSPETRTHPRKKPRVQENTNSPPSAPALNIKSLAKAHYLEWIFIITNLFLEILSAILDQISSPKKPNYALSGLVVSCVVMVVSASELIFKAKIQKVKLKRRGLKFWIDYSLASHRGSFSSFVDIFGLICGFCQCIFSSITYIYHSRHADNPIKIPILPIIFIICLVFAKSIKDKKQSPSHVV